jgi:hypothetical protein
MLLAVTALVIGPRSVDLLLERISTLKVIGVLRAPVLIGLALVFLAAGRPTTSLLPVFEPWMGMKPATTERTPPPLQHKLLPDRRRWGDLPAAVIEVPGEEAGGGWTKDEVEGKSLYHLKDEEEEKLTT